MKLFESQYFDLHDADLNELYQFVNCGLTDDAKINNSQDLVKFLLPNIQLDVANANKLKSFLYSLNVAVHDLGMMQELIQLHGKYEAFNCYKRVVIKFAIDIVQLCNVTDYLTCEVPSPSDDIAQSAIIQRFKSQLDADDTGTFARIFF